jgi:predicted nucleotide-binding protein
VARRTTSPEGGRASLPQLTVSRTELAQQVAERIAHGQELLSRVVETEDELGRLQESCRRWDDYNLTLLRRSFSTSEPAEQYRPPAVTTIWAGRELTLQEKLKRTHAGAGRAIQALESLKERLHLYDEEVAKAPTSSRTQAMPGTNATIFLVHGRSEAAKQVVARFLEQISDLRVVILHEQPNSGRTIIEKFESYASGADFAVVLLTGDDEGGLASSRQRRRRARQNVVFELGFFIAALGRAQVAVLYEEGVELPSDMSGVLYTALDASGGWKMELAREMVAARLPVDLNRVLT